MQASDDVNRVYQRFGSRAQFLLVYIREAHPTDGWRMRNSKITDPLTQLERNGVASECCQQLKFDFPTVVDTMDDHTAVHWAAWPERIFVVGHDGNVAYAGQQGPWGFWPTDRLKRNGRSKRMKGDSLEAFLARLFGENPRAEHVDPLVAGAEGEGRTLSPRASVTERTRE